MSKRKGGNINELVEQTKQLEKRVAFQEDRNAILEKQNTELRKEVSMLTKENDELLNRLSKIAGDYMTRGNPHIADLSDQNRPTKLAEKWSNLYTEEWVEAFDELGRKSNDSFKVEKHLKDIAVQCYGQCQAIANEQLQRLRYTLEDIESYMQDTEHTLNLSFNKSRRIDRRQDPRFIDNIINTYKQRRCRDELWIEAVRKKCASEYVSKNGTRSKKVLTYVYKCAELCWYMCAQDTPMVLEYDSYQGQEVDRNKFNLYDGKGNIVDFVVWPALLLKQGAGLCLLSKGVVHPVSSHPNKPVSKRKSKEKMESLVSPTNIHKDLPRIPSNNSIRTPSPYKVSTRKKVSTGSVIDAKSTAPSSATMEGAGNSNNVPRITNPEKLLSARKSDTLLSHKHPPTFGKTQKDLMKTVKGKPPTFANIHV